MNILSPDDDDDDKNDGSNGDGNKQPTNYVHNYIIHCGNKEQQHSAA